MMSGRKRGIAVAAVALVGLALPVLATPGLRNARIEERSAVAGLEAAVRAAAGSPGAASWIAYRVPALGGHSHCCHDWARNVETGCRLDEEHGSYGSGDGDALRTSAPMEVVLHVAEARVTGIRVFSEDCAVDAGGATVVLLNDVAPRQSLEFLASLAATGSGKGERLRESALMAIAFHDDTAADGVLDGLAAPAQPDSIREKAAFWMGAARGERGYQSLKRLLAGNGTDQFREKVVFALSISHLPGSLETILDTARRDPSARVRGQALFWLAQAAGAKAADGITRAIAEDPETDVKKKAVFALSQLPKDQGVPLLVQTARTNRNPAVRKEAMFWLGQSNDPRALAFFQEVLGR
jgi:hypothetical protein